MLGHPSLTSYHDVAQPPSSSLKHWRCPAVSSSPLTFNQWRESLWYLLVQWSINNKTPQNLTDLPRSPLPMMRPLKKLYPLWSMDAFPSPFKTTRPPQPIPHCSQWAAIYLPLVYLTPEPLIAHGAYPWTICIMYPQAHGRRGSLSSQPNPCHWLESVAHWFLTIYQLILEIYLMVPSQMLPLPLKPQPLRSLMAQMAGTWMSAPPCEWCYSCGMRLKVCLYSGVPRTTCLSSPPTIPEWTWHQDSC